LLWQKDNDVAIATYLRNGFKSTEFEILVAPFVIRRGNKGVIKLIDLK
jgi:hypothetical protein